MRRALLMVALAVFAAGCGSSSGPTGEATTAASAPPEKTRVVVYVVKEGKLAAERRLVPHTKAVARAALGELGFAVTSLAIDGGTATVELGSSPTDLERAQVVFTLTEFPSVEQVAIDGRTLTRTDEDL